MRMAHGFRSVCEAGDPRLLTCMLVCAEVRILQCGCVVHSFITLHSRFLCVGAHVKGRVLTPQWAVGESQRPWCSTLVPGSTGTH